MPAGHGPNCPLAFCQEMRQTEWRILLGDGVYFSRFSKVNCEHLSLCVCVLVLRCFVLFHSAQFKRMQCG